MLLTVGALFAADVFAQPASADAFKPALVAGGDPPASTTLPGAARDLDDANLVLLEMRIDGFLLADSINAYQAAQKIFLPLGEVARALTIAIRVDPARRTATGFVRREDTGFTLNLNTGTLELGARSTPFDMGEVMPKEDDIYVEIRTLADWLQVDFAVNMNSLQVDVTPIEPLPIQMRLKREREIERLKGQKQQERPDLPRLKLAYKLADVPFIDQTISLGARRGNGANSNTATTTTYIKGDLAGMQASAYLTTSNARGSTQSRFTLGRTDPDAELLGPLRARHFSFGDVPVAGITNLTRTNDTGRGITINNMPIDQPTRFDTHTLQGDLPPGWDVELFFNDALVGYQQSGPDGKYRFDDLPLVFGANEFRLVFHGPQGQLRVERQTFLLDDSMSTPGTFHYNVATSHDRIGLRHSVALAEYGLSKSMTVSGSVIDDERPDGTVGRYSTLGLRTFVGPALFTGNLTRQSQGGTLTDLGLKTRIGKTAFSYNRLQASGNFNSEFFPATGDPTRSRDRLRIDGMLPGGGAFGVLPYNIQIQRDTTRAGNTITDSTALISASYGSISLSNQLHLGLAPGSRVLDGTFSSGSSFGSFRLRGQINYLLRPETRFSAMAINADRTLRNGYLVNLGLARSFTSPELGSTISLNKSLGKYGLALTGGYSSRGEYSVGIVFFIGLGRDPRGNQWVTSGTPLADSGATSALVFLDRNANGVFDNGEERLRGVGLQVNGANVPVRTDANGLVFIERLAPWRDVDITLNRSTIEDPMMAPLGKGYRLVPRPGNVAQLDFPVVYTVELDGTVYLVTDGKRRGASNVQLELVDLNQNIIATTRSEYNGFYHFGEVTPGQYQIRVSQRQMEDLKLQSSPPITITVPADGEPVPSSEIELRRLDGR